MKNNPAAGAVGPAALRFFAAKISSISYGYQDLFLPAFQPYYVPDDAKKNGQKIQILHNRHHA